MSDRESIERIRKSIERIRALQNARLNLARLCRQIEAARDRVYIAHAAATPEEIAEVNRYIAEIESEARKGLPM